MTTPDQPGWYDDPNDSNAQRYWDGQKWTPHRQRKPRSPQTQAPATPATPPPPPPSNLPPPPPTPTLPPPPPQVQEPPPAQQPAASRRRRRRAPIALVALIAVLAVAGLLAYKFVLPRVSTSLSGSHNNSAAPQASASGAPQAPSGAAPQAPSGGAPQAPPGGAPQAPPGGAKSGILALNSAGNKRTYGFIDPNSAKYSETVTFTIPTTGSTQAASYPALAASPDLTKFAVSSMVNGQLMAGWIDSSGQFTAVTTAAAGGAFAGNPPSYSAIGFDKAGNYYYKKNSQGAMYTEVYEVPAGSTSNAQKLTVTPPGAVDQGIALNSDGSLLFGCSNMTGNWLDANTMVLAIAPGTQIAKVALAGRGPGGCPITPASNEVPLLPPTNSAMVHDPVANSDGTKVAFLYDDPDRVHHNFASVYIVGTDGKSQPTLVNLSESDAKKLGVPTLLRWS